MKLNTIVLVTVFSVLPAALAVSTTAAGAEPAASPEPIFGATAQSDPPTRELAEALSMATGGGPIPDFEGEVAVARPLPPLPMPAHPYQDNRGYAGAHGDSYNSGTIPAAGPLGKDIQVHSRIAGKGPAFCSTQHFDLKGRVVTVCVGRNRPTKLLLLDPNDLEILAVHDLPPMAGFYFRMDKDGRVVVPAGDLSIQIFEIDDSGDAPDWRLVKRYDLNAAVPEELRMPSTLPRGEELTRPMTFPLDIVADWDGNWWFTILNPAIVGYVDKNGRVHSHIFEGETIENGLSADPEGIYVASSKKLYGLRAGDNGIDVFASFPYETGTGERSFGSGTGTTPVLFANKLIAFADNADPRPNVLVYRLDDVPDERRLVCKVPVFKPGRTALENSFIGYDHSLVIENNMGFKMVGDSSRAEPGFARIDVRRDLSGCDLVWENYTVRAGTGAKLSLGTGLIYVHELLMNTGDVDAWYVTAIDFETGKRVWRKYVGSGQQWDNALLTMSIGPDGLLTSGTYAGLLSARDSH